MLGVAAALVGCSASGGDLAIVNCFNELTDSGKVPAAKDVKLDLDVRDDVGGYLVTGVAYATTFSGTLTPLNITCHVGSTGTVQSADVAMPQ